MHRLMLLCLILPGLTACGALHPRRAAAPGLPEDVAQFKERRDLCDHFRGEEPYDEERRSFLEENLIRYCTGTDDELAALRLKYGSEPDVLKALESYDDNIEGMK